MTNVGRLFAGIGTVVGVAMLLSCDEAVYHPDEIRAEKKFKAIAIGITEEALTKQLGEPKGRLVFDKARGTYQYFTSSNSTPLLEFRLQDQINDTSPPELRLLPRNKRAERILVFVDGTVYGYYYFGQSERVEDKVVLVS